VVESVAARLAAILALLWFVYDTAIPAWHGPSSDFPNYYTAARLARAREPLRLYYDWTWFQKRIDEAGFGRQLGGYVPQTPVAMLPYVPLAGMNPLSARRAWVILNCGFVAATLWMLSRITGLGMPELWLVAVAGYATLRSNFVLGQYYVFLLALLTMGAWLVLRKKEFAGGVLWGSALALKLYGGPLMLFALARRRWRLAGGMVVVSALALALAVVWFGWRDVEYFATAVLPRALTGEIIDPYHPANGAVTALLRRMFVREADLNPAPLFESPFAFAFLSSFFTLGVLALPALSGSAISRRSLAWWMIAILAVSPNLVSYSYLLALLPTVLQMSEMPRRLWVWPLAAYVLLAAPLRWKAALLIAYFVAAGWREIRRERAGLALAGAAAVSLVVALAGGRPTQFARVGSHAEEVYLNRPAVSRAGIVYERMTRDRYAVSGVAFDGNSFHPAMTDSGAIYFEGSGKIVRSDGAAVVVGEEPAVSRDGLKLAFVSGGTLYLKDGDTVRRIGLGQDPSFSADRRLLFVRGGTVTDGSATLLNDTAPLASPSLSDDGRTLAFSARRGWSWQVWTKDLATGTERRITDGNCNNDHPVWEPGSRAIVFASDCGRGFGMPALFRADVGN
jgi:hypothetical protein